MEPASTFLLYTKGNNSKPTNPNIPEWNLELKGTENHGHLVPMYPNNSDSPTQFCVLSEASETERPTSLLPPFISASPSILKDTLGKPLE